MLLSGSEKLAMVMRIRMADGYIVEQISAIIKSRLGCHLVFCRVVGNAIPSHFNNRCMFDCLSAVGDRLAIILRRYLEAQHSGYTVSLDFRWISEELTGSLAANISFIGRRSR